MYRQVCQRFPMILWAVFLAAATGPASGQGVEETWVLDFRMAAGLLAEDILGPVDSRPRLPLASDAEHARTIDPVLTESTAIWIHEALPKPPLTVVGGRVFSYHDLAYDPLEAPVLKIRPIDDDQVIPFLARIIIKPDAGVPEGSVAAVSFPAPAIFEPRLSGVEAWAGSRSTPVSIERSLAKALLTIRAPLSPAIVGSSRGADDTITVIIEGELALAVYEPIPARWFSELESSKIDQAVGGLARLEIDRDIDGDGDASQLQRIATALSADSSTPYDRVVTVNSWISDHLQYKESPASRTAVEALEDRSGDCDEHTTLMAALLRSMGIPARRATGLLYNFDTLSTHAWVEVGLPRRDGPVSWFIVDPTLAGTSPSEEEKINYVQFNDRMLLYPIRPSVGIEGFIGRWTTDILLNWREQTATPLTDPSQANRFVDLVTSSVDREISAGAERLADSDLLLRRESASIVGSPYVILDRTLARQSSNRVRLRLENEERLVLDLSVGNEPEVDDEAIDRMRTVYRDLSRSIFAGKPAHRNLELVYIRDRHSDQLHTVSLRVGRYLVEHQLGRILRRLAKAGLLTEEETARIAAVADTSRGRNLYLLQELARRVPAVESP
jgi:transglutaminase-like putative cysteine protease